MNILCVTAILFSPPSFDILQLVSWRGDAFETLSSVPLNRVVEGAHTIVGGAAFASLLSCWSVREQRKHKHDVGAKGARELQRDVLEGCLYGFNSLQLRS